MNRAHLPSSFCLILLLLLSACGNTDEPPSTPEPAPTRAFPTPAAAFTPLPPPPPHLPRELGAFTAPSGETPPPPAGRLNNSVGQTPAANPILPQHPHNLPPGP